MMRLWPPVLVWLALASRAEPVFAFHDGGAAACSACHVMHVAAEGPGTPTTGGELLAGPSPSDTCLRCHAAYGQFAGGEGFGPGGDFHWLSRTWIWSTPGGAPAASPGASHGHNVVAPGFGLVPDPVNARAPGGDFPAASLGCTSCHDPHGNASFRLLYGAGNGPATAAGRFAFGAPAPVALGNGPFTVPGRPGGGDETDSRHTIFLSGLSAWCANCHGLYHEEQAGGFRHPAGGGLGARQAARYNRYAGVAAPTGGDEATAYWGLVPFEAATAEPSALDPASHTSGPQPGDRVMCLSCHRAHASPFRAAGRWDFDAALLADSHPAPTDGGASATDVERRYYAYLLPPGQTSLCAKCHDSIPDGGADPRFPGD